MIYILGKTERYEAYELDDIVVMASTKIEDILEYLIRNVPLDYMSDHHIYVTPENSRLYEIINPYSDAYKTFVNFTPNMFTIEEHKSEYEHVENQLFIWCNAIKDKREKEEAEHKRIEKEKKEKQERELYEKLKAKYGD